MPSIIARKRPRLRLYGSEWRFDTTPGSLFMRLPIARIGKPVCYLEPVRAWLRENPDAVRRVGPIAFVRKSRLPRDRFLMDTFS